LLQTKTPFFNNPGSVKAGRLWCFCEYKDIAQIRKCLIAIFTLSYAALSAMLLQARLSPASIAAGTRPGRAYDRLSSRRNVHAPSINQVNIRNKKT